MLFNNLPLWSSKIEGQLLRHLGQSGDLGQREMKRWATDNRLSDAGIGKENKVTIGGIKAYPNLLLGISAPDRIVVMLSA